MDFLARREHTAKEVFLKLEKRVESIEILSVEIEKLEEEGLINDQRFAEQYIHSRSAKGYGPLRIEIELNQRGVHKNIFLPLIKNIDWITPEGSGGPYYPNM